MNRLFSLLLSLLDEIIPYFRPSNRKGFVSIILIVSANSIPIIGVISFKWNPYMILLIYWGESLIIGFFNLLKMLISGAVENRKFSPSGFAQGAGLSIFFTIHYGIFMLVHGIFIIIFMMISLSMETTGGGADIDPFSFISMLFPGDMTTVELLQSEFSAVAALFLSHLISFFMYFVKTGEYKYKNAPDYMMRPYKRILIMHMTIILGAFALFISGFQSAVFIIIWIGLKILSDLKMHISEIKKYAPSGL